MKTLARPNLGPEVIIAGYNELVLEQIDNYNKIHADQQIVLPADLKPIGYGFSDDCDS